LVGNQYLLSLRFVSLLLSQSKVYLIQPYVIKFVSYLCKVGGFFWVQTTSHDQWCNGEHVRLECGRSRIQVQRLLNWCLLLLS